MQALRSLLFNFIVIVTAVIAAIIAVFTFPLPPLRRYHIVCRWGRFITWLATRLCGIRYHVDGREHLPHKQSAILFANPALVFTSALTGLPPFYVVSVAAGMLRFRTGSFLVARLAGRLLRFSAVFALPGVLLWVLS